MTTKAARLAFRAARWACVFARPAYRWSGLVVAAVLLLALTPWTGRITYDQDIESLLPANDPTVVAFKELRQRLGGTRAILMVWQVDELFAASGEGLAEVTRVAEAARALEVVTSTLSVRELNHALELIEPLELNFFDNAPRRPPLLEEEPLAAAFRDLFAGYTHGAAEDWAAVAVLLDREADAETALREVRQLAQRFSKPDRPVYLVGEPELLHEGVRLLREDGRRLGWMVLGLLVLTLLVLLRNLRWIIAILLIVLWSRWVTRAVLAISGMQLTMVSGMLDAVLTVVAVAAVVHVALRHWSLRHRRYPVHVARRTWQDLLRPLWWSLATTALGFASLAISTIVPVQQFGTMMAIGTLLVFAGVLLIAPAFVNEASKILARRQDRARFDRRVQRGLAVSLEQIVRRPAMVIGMLSVMTVIAAAGLLRLEVETNFLRNFREGSPIVRAYQVVEQRLGGAGVWDIMLDAPAALDPAYVDLVLDLEQRLRTIETDRGARLTKVLSLLDVDRAVARHRPLLAAAGSTVRFAGMQAALPNFYATLISDADDAGVRTLRILLRSPEQLSADDKLQLIARVEQELNQTTSQPEWHQHFPPTSSGKGAVTGYYVLLAQLVSRLLTDQWNSLGIATAAILVCLRLAVGSWRLAIVGILPSLLPILAVLGVMGWMQVKVNLGAAMTAAVSIGLSIDGSIHYLTAYQRARQCGQSRRLALHRAQRSVGTAVTVATCALAIGLLTLITSPLLPTAAFGLLSGTTLVAGLIGNLIFLPALLSFPRTGRMKST